MSGAAIRGVYAITPEIADTEGLLDRVSLALKGGVRVVQYRNKNAPAELKHQQSLALQTLCRGFEVPFIINDDVELAAHVGADGVHLGQTDATISEARAMLGVNSIIGASCYNQIALAERALSEGADYVAFGSFFPTANKRDAVVAPLDILREAKGRFRAPVVAIGGIQLENAGGPSPRVLTRSRLFQAFSTLATSPRQHAFSVNSLSFMSRNQKLFDRSCRVIPGGVNSPVRAFRAVGGTPRFIARAQGAYVWDAEGTRYIDYLGSWGPMILGHGHPAVLEAVQRAASRGLSFGAPTEAEIELAEAIIALVPSVEQVRLVSSGTEAAMSAIRLARGATGRSKLIKFEGCYHGHADALLVKAGSGLATFGHPTSAGVPAEVVQHTLVLEYNNLAQLEAAFTEHGRELACVMIEPIAGNMNFVRAQVPFVKRLRELCTQHGTLLVFDEVMTGFRVALGGAQSLYAQAIAGFKPDISVFGKVIGGGMPLAAFGATRDVMGQLAPLGPVYQAGTLSGNPVATACGLATLREIAKPGFFEALSTKTRAVVQALTSAARDSGVAFSADCEGGMFGFFFNAALPQHYTAVMATDKERFNRFFHGMLARGVYLAPALYEAGFVSAAHSDADIAATAAAAREALLG